MDKSITTTGEKQSSTETNDSSSSEEEFFDANTSSSEEVSKSSQLQGNDNNDGGQKSDVKAEGEEVGALVTCLKEDEKRVESEDPQKSAPESINMPSTASMSNIPETEMFVTPKPPPRRNRGRANSLKSIQGQTVSLDQDTSSELTPFVVTPVVAGDSSAFKTTLLTMEDIASIQGDLSVNEALLTGDKRSICVDDLSCEKITTTDINQPKEMFSSHRFKYDQDEQQLVEATRSQIPTESSLTQSFERQATLTEEDSSESTTVMQDHQFLKKEMEKKEETPDQKQEGQSIKSEARGSTGDPLLEEVIVKNMDTGETLPLSAVDEIVGKCINPLNLHLLKITNDYASDAEDTDAGTSSIEGKDKDSIEEGHDDPPEGESGSSSLSRRAGKQMKTKLKGGLKKVGRVGKNMIQGAKQTVEVVREKHSRLKEQHQSQNLHPEHPLGHSDAVSSSHHQFRLKINKKTPADFEGLKVVQELHDCRGAVWVMKWSLEGQLLAVAGQDQLLRVYCSSKAWKYFTQLRNKASGQQTSPASTKDRSFSGSRSNSMSSCDNLSMDSAFSPNAVNSRLWSEDNTLSEEGPLLLFSAYRGHTADVLDISWSKNHFLLSSSMDKTVRLWHITRIECLCTLRHADFVTTISFHPKDDRYFLSGSLDGKLRLWNIPDKRVTLWNEVSAGSSQPLSATSSSSTTKDSDSSQSHGLITASAFVQNGKFAVIGTYDGRVIFYTTDQLKYFTQLHVSAKGVISTALSTDLASLEGKKGMSRRKRRRNNNKVTGIESVDDNKILVTTNDSRLRLYDLRDLSLACKYKGCVNISSQIRASVSHDNKYIVCGSENSSFYIWRLQETTAIGQRKDKNNLWESVRILPASSSTPSGMGLMSGVPPVDQAACSSSMSSSLNPPPAATSGKPSSPGIITAATFAPAPKYLEDEATYVIAAADFTGCIRLFSK